MVCYRTFATSAVAACFCFVLASCGGGGGSNDPIPPTTIKTLSNRADLVSGGSVLVEITIPASRTASPLRVDVDGVEVTTSFTAQGGGRFLGVVKGLKNGANVITARAIDGNYGIAKLTITNHPIGGPVLFSAQAGPWVCATPSPVAAAGNTPASNASGPTARLCWLVSRLGISNNG